MITGERVYLRELDSSVDLEKYLSWLSNPNTSKFLSIDPTRITCSEILEWVLDSQLSPTCAAFGIYLHDMTFIGTTRLSEINTENGSAELGIMIGDHTLQGMGLGTEVIRLITIWGLEEFGLSRIEAGVSTDNHPSLVAFGRAGFIEIGRRPSRNPDSNSEGIRMIFTADAI